MICISLLLTINLFSAPKSSEDLYDLIRENYTKNFPSDFVAGVYGYEIANSVSKIPKESYCKGKSPRVTYLFLRGQEESIIVENVENPYVTRFQTHLEVYKRAKVFLNQDMTFDNLKKTFHWEYLPSLSKGYYVVKMRKHIVRASDYFLLYFNKSNYTLATAVQYSNNRPIGTIVVYYTSKGGYILPSQIRVNYVKNGQRKQITLNIAGYKINIGLTMSKIIQLQDDCPSVDR